MSTLSIFEIIITDYNSDIFAQYAIFIPSVCMYGKIHILLELSTCLEILYSCLAKQIRKLINHNL